MITLTDGWTPAATEAFFLHSMALPAPIIARLALDGITTVVDLRDKEDYNWDSIYLRIIKDPAITVHFGDHSLTRLKTASTAVRYYIAIARIIKPDMMLWDVLRNFREGMMILKETKARDQPTVPKLSKSFGLIKWATAFRNVLSQTYSSSKLPIPLCYVLREKEEREDPPPPLAADQAHAQDGSYHEELIARAPLKGPTFQADDNLVWHALDESTRGQTQNTTVQQFYRRNKGQGRKAFFSIIAQHLGDDKWNSEVKKHEAVLHGAQWKGTGNQRLEHFIGLHRNAYNGLVLCEKHIQYQLPTEFTRVGYLLDNIHSADADLAAAKSSVSQDKGPNGKRNNFEQASVVLQEACPVTKKLIKR